jgi:hypothetical protein
MDLEDLEGKMAFSEVSGGYLWNFEWLESFGVKEQGILQSLGIFPGFWWIFVVFGVV